MERVEFALRAAGYRPLGAIEVSVHEGAVQLTGTVPSYYMKQIAQTRAMAVPGVIRIFNEIEVPPPT